MKEGGSWVLNALCYEYNTSHLTNDLKDRQPVSATSVASLYKQREEWTNLGTG